MKHHGTNVQIHINGKDIVDAVSRADWSKWADDCVAAGQRVADALKSDAVAHAPIDTGKTRLIELD